jgi:alkanesulfonate monooxygenase SsuD/methylene tetrahydromethanopterin reductase-like flavin-dependent oxidoreductase (luciferase family)
MEFGLYLVTQFDAAQELRGIGDELVAQTALAREGGFDAVHVGEHHVTASDQYLLNEAAIAHLAEHVGEMSLGATLCLLPYHNPVRIAEFGATVDVLSGGNFQLGVGLGYRPEEYAAFGVTREDAPGRLEEGVEVIKRLWTEGSVTFDGDHFQFEDVSIRPRPLQDPRPPVWVGASNPASVRRAARIGDGFVGAHVPLGVARKQVRAFRETRAAGGSEGTVALLREAFVAPTTEEAERLVREPLMAKYGSYSDWGQDDVIEGDDFDSPWDQLSHERFLVGSPDDVIEGIERYQAELDLDQLIVRMQFPTSDFADVRDSLALFSEEVVPSVS